MTDLATMTDADLMVEHAIRRERHATHFANVECGIGDEAHEARARDACFDALGPTAAELRRRGYHLRHDDSRPIEGVA